MGLEPRDKGCLWAAERSHRLAGSLAFSEPARVGTGYTDMTQRFPEDCFTWLNLVGNTMPPRHPSQPNNDDDDAEAEDDDEKDKDREPAVIREPDEGE
jgi:hypothetical protein